MLSVFFTIFTGCSTRHDMIGYDTICCFNVRSKADMSQLNLLHGNDKLKSEKKQKKTKK